MTIRTKNIIPSTKNSCHRSLWRRRSFLLAFVVAAAWPAFAPRTQAQGCSSFCNTFEGNTAFGNGALAQNTGSENTAFGIGALGSNTSGGDNTATGESSLGSNTTGSHNTATGQLALSSNTTGAANTAVGDRALSSNSTGANNVAIGYQALNFNTTGVQNTATGLFALFSNTTGNNNTASGQDALDANTKGDNNTAAGASALAHNTSGSHNTAFGVNTIASSTIGDFNNALGEAALFHNSTGAGNTGVGDFALFNSTTGSNNIAVGGSAGDKLTTGDSNIDIGNEGVAGESGVIRIGVKAAHKSTFISGISGVAVTGSQVIVSTNGKLGVAASSARFKDGIKPMDKASEVVLKLEPVSFRYKKDLDPAGIPQFGLVAEQVEKIDPDLVARDEEGKAYTVRYEAVNAMLLNEFLKEHRKVAELSAKLETQQKEAQAKFAQQAQQIEALTAGLQKVSEQVQASNPTLVAASTH